MLQYQKNYILKLLYHAIEVIYVKSLSYGIIIVGLLY